MKLIHASYEVMLQDCVADRTFPSLIEAAHKHIEKCGRICYKSEDLITEDSSRRFINGLMKSEHFTVLEHGSIYLRFPKRWPSKFEDALTDKYKIMGMVAKPIIFIEDREFNYYSTNIAYVLEAFNLYGIDIKDHNFNTYVVPYDPTHHELRVSVKFTTNIGVSHEFVRYRSMSICQESTRYCNYSKDKFGNQLTFIIPVWWHDKIEEGEYLGNFENYSKSQEINNWMQHCLDTECAYMDAIEYGGLKPQQASNYLNKALKTELVLTGFIGDWAHFFNQRALGLTGVPHPQAKELAEPLMKHFIDGNIYDGLLENLGAWRQHARKQYNNICKLFNNYNKMYGVVHVNENKNHPGSDFGDFV